MWDFVFSDDRTGPADESKGQNASRDGLVKLREGDLLLAILLL